jgi:hypothetical protein
MDLGSFLLQERKNILSRWFHAVTETYPPETARILRTQSNEFANPVGHATHYGLEGVYDEFIREADPDRLTPFLDRIIRIRAVQDFSPTQALAFVFLLKQIVRNHLKESPAATQVSFEELSAFDSKVDELALLAFNIYTQCRERLFEVRVAEVKSRSHRLLQMANLIGEIPEQESNVKDGKTQ